MASTKPTDLEALKQQLVLWSSRGVGVETSKAFQSFLKKLRKNKTQAYSLFIRLLHSSIPFPSHPIPSHPFPSLPFVQSDKERKKQERE